MFEKSQGHSKKNATKIEGAGGRWTDWCQIGAQGHGYCGLCLKGYQLGWKDGLGFLDALSLSQCSGLMKWSIVPFPSPDSSVTTRLSIFRTEAWPQGLK